MKLEISNEYPTEPIPDWVMCAFNIDAEIIQAEIDRRIIEDIEQRARRDYD